MVGEGWKGGKTGETVMGSTQVGGLGLEAVAEGGRGGPQNDSGHLSSSRTRDGGSNGVTPRASCLVPELKLGEGGGSLQSW